jgi:hypothetical protein
MKAIVSLSLGAVLLVMGILVGGSQVYEHMRMNALEQRQDSFERGVENFAKQVDARLNPNPQVTAKEVPANPAKK